MRRFIVLSILRLFVLLLAVGVYLFLLPIKISTDPFRIEFPIIFRFSGVPDPVHWNYILLLPLSLFIIFVGFEIIKLMERQKKN